MASWQPFPVPTPLDVRDPDAGPGQPGSSQKPSQHRREQTSACAAGREVASKSRVFAHPSAVLAGRRVLVADDDDDLRLAVADALATMHAQVLLARNGAEAVRMALDERPELILLDYRMPLLDGGQVIEALATQGVSTSIVLMTADSEARVLAQRLGSVQYLEKPFSLYALRELLIQLVLQSP